jgi:putative molybdopterin biosynthesis protein
MPEYFSSSEVARYLKLNLKKIYALVASGGLPAARISGKWLFQRELVDEWVAGCTVNRPGGVMRALLDQLLVLQGSDDWLLSRVIDRFQWRFGAAIPTAFVGSLAGLSAVATGNAHLASCHVASEVVREHTRLPVYQFGLFAREQGILLAREQYTGIKDLNALSRLGLRFAQRQERSGTFRLVERLVAEYRLQPRWTPVGPFSSHLELAFAIRNGQADAGVGIRMAAKIADLHFVPLVREQFDLVIPASFMSHRRLSDFLEFLVSELSAEARNGHAGYTFEALGRLQAFPCEAQPKP